MAFWNSYLQLLWKLQFFNRLGSMFWSFIPFPLLLCYIYFDQTSSEFTTEKTIKVLSYLITFSWIGFLATIPQCIHSFREYTRTEAGTTTLVEPQGEAEDEAPASTTVGWLLPPSRTIWLVAIDWLTIAILSVEVAINNFSLHFGLQSTILTTLTFIYFTKFGILFGSLTKTLSSECKTINPGYRRDNFEMATCLLYKYQNLKNASKLGLFTATTTCTVLTISSTYMTIIFSHSCLNYNIGPSEYLTGILQVIGFTLYFFFFATSVDECQESFEGMARHLR